MSHCANTLKQLNNRHTIEVNIMRGRKDTFSQRVQKQAIKNIKKKRK